MSANVPLVTPRPPRPRIFTYLSIGLALAVAGLWAVDNFLGRDRMKVVLMILLVFLGALLIIWLAIWLIRKLIGALSAASRRRQEAAAAAPQMGATPQEQAELDGLQERVNTAVRVLRESKLARGHKGDEVLYALPWVLMLGPGESGKTTVLQECGLEFPYTTAEGLRQRGAPPAGGEFWFSRSGVVIDLQGRIGTEEDWYDVFKGFMNQLKRARRERPLDGVVVAVDLADLLARPEKETERLAAGLRHRIDEMVRRFGIRFPVYVLFTKCDRIEGFHSFFGNMRSRDRAQVWGATISRAERRTASNEKLFAQEFDRLIDALSPFRLQLMASEQDPQKLPWIYTFPRHLGSIRGRLNGFMATLLQPTPYSERPLFRGFYLTGAAAATAETPEPPQAQPGWEPGRRLAAAEAPPKSSKNFFLDSLLPGIVFADKPLASASVGTRLRRRLWLDVAFVSLLAVSAVLLVGMVFSFNENRGLIESTRRLALRVTEAGWDGKRTTDLMALEDLRAQVEELDRHAAEGAPWTLRWGLYTGSRINPPVRHVYFQRLRQSFVTPTAEALRQKLNALSADVESASSFDEFYTYLKAYLMMTEPPRAEASFLNNALAPTWKPFASGSAEEVALRQLRFYAEQLPKNEPELQLTQDTELVARARRALSRFPVLVRLYNSLKSEGNAKFQPYSLAAATGGKSLEFLSSSYDVPGVFTEQAWRTYFKGASAEASRAVIKDDWVLGPTYSQISTAQASDAEYQRQLLDMYFVEYSDQWLRFLEGISVRSLADLTEARAALNSLSEQDSAISRLLLNVTAQTMLRREPEKGTGIGEIVSGALATLGLTSRVNREELVAVVGGQFLPLHDLVTSPDGKSPSIAAQYVDVLGRVHSKLESLFGAGTQWEQVKAYIGMIATNISGDEFHDAYRLTARISQMCRTKSTLPIGPLLEKPMREVWAAILRDAGYRIDGLWRTRVAETFRREVETRFPFNPAGPDLPLSLLSQYLKPGDGTVWAFFDSELKPFLSPSEDGWAAANMIGAQIDFSRPFLSFLQKANDVRQAVYGG
ncbi:MAG: type VI secretion system membrane subunit TssM, partial [Acidobacteria bacterium]|nr:type VI secretion system membrane subunit TssM [Acidobacteriota bacterium]